MKMFRMGRYERLLLTESDSYRVRFLIVYPVNRQVSTLYTITDLAVENWYRLGRHTNRISTATSFLTAFQELEILLL